MPSGASGLSVGYFLPAVPAAVSAIKTAAVLLFAPEPGYNLGLVSTHSTSQLLNKRTVSIVSS